MAFNNWTNTKWVISEDEVTIFPFRISKLLAFIFGGLAILLCAAFWFIEHTSFEVILPIIAPILFIAGLIWMGGKTSAIFDNRKGVFKRKLFNILPVSTIPFSKLHAVNVVNQTLGGYSYKLFRKNARYGKGITISSGYSKNNDANATAFVNDVIPRIHAFLDRHDPQGLEKLADIEHFKYFKEEDGVYEVRNGKVSNLIYALVFIGLSIFLATLIEEKTTGVWIGQGFFLIMTIVFANNAFTHFIFDPNAGIVKKKALFAFLNKEFDYKYYIGVQTIRHSTNGIYSRTSVNLNFLSSDKSKSAQEVEVASFYRVSKVERFMQEYQQIIRLN